MKKIASILFLWLPLVCAGSPGFKFKSAIDSVPKEGYYKIMLSPEIIAGAKSDYSDIRILDANDREVPYIFVPEEAVTVYTGFKEYEMIVNKFDPKRLVTRVVVHNPAKNSISSLHIEVRNADVEKQFILKGSDNQENWFMIKQSSTGQLSHIPGETTQILILNFPNSNYEYFELTLNDRKRDPLQILKVGFYDENIVHGRYREIPAPAIKQTDTAKKSYVKLKFLKEYEIDKLEFEVAGPELFLRHCSLVRYEQRKKKAEAETIGWFSLSSQSPLCWDLDKLRASELTMVIDNLDDAPLVIKGVKAFQLNKYLVAKLKPGQTFHLFYGDATLKAPEYDLAYFADGIKDPPVITNGKQIVINSDVRKKPIFFNSTFLWIAIIFIALILGWFSIRLVKEVTNR